MLEDQVYVFQYGSNMNPDRLNSTDRLDGAAGIVGVGRLSGWGVTFDLFSVNNACGVTDIVQTRDDQHVLGVVYKVPAKALSRMDGFEGVRRDGQGNYERQEVTVIVEGQPVSTITYVGTTAGRRRFQDRTTDERRVSTAYFSHLLEGSDRFQFPDSYKAYLVRQAGSLK